MNIAVVVVSLLVAMTVHEFMHAYVGHMLGDTTARDEGRISLNPIKHIDPFMTVILPAIAWLYFGFLVMAAKPVPFNPHRLKYGDFGAALLAAAGPVSNLLLAVGAAVLLRNSNVIEATGQALLTFTQLNVALFVFNLIPIPPLDGSRVLYAFAPDGVRDFMNRMEPYGLFIVIALVMLGGLGGVITNLNQSVLDYLL
jgi:Zn-dependent protease